MPAPRFGLRSFGAASDVGPQACRSRHMPCGPPAVRPKMSPPAGRFAGRAVRREREGYAASAVRVCHDVDADRMWRRRKTTPRPGSGDDVQRLGRRQSIVLTPTEGGCCAWVTGPLRFESYNPDLMGWTPGNYADVSGVPTNQARPPRSVSRGTRSATPATRRCLSTCCSPAKSAGRTSRSTGRTASKARRCGAISRLSKARSTLRSARCRRAPRCAKPSGRHSLAV